MKDNTVQKENVTFGDMVANLAKPGIDIIKELTPTQADMLHMGVGVSGEAGELLDAIKKYCIYQKDLDKNNIVEELGDIEFYIERIRQIINVSRSQILEHNMNKLFKRYDEFKYSNEQAQNRADKPS